MTNTLFDLKLVETTLDDVPRAMRTAPGCLTVTAAEKALCEAYDVPTLKRLLGYVLQDEFGRASKAEDAPQ